jgi:ABC-type multidrug transport system ATPase subunit
MKKRLAMAAALMHDPDVLIVDEPMVGLDPKGALKVRNLFKDLASKGMTIFLTTHELSTAEAVCDRIGIIHPGSQLEEIFLKLTIESEGEEEALFGSGASEESPKSKVQSPKE